MTCTVRQTEQREMLSGPLNLAVDVIRERATTVNWKFLVFSMLPFLTMRLFLVLFSVRNRRWIQHNRKLLPPHLWMHKPESISTVSINHVQMYSRTRPVLVLSVIPRDEWFRISVKQDNTKVICLLVSNKGYQSDSSPTIFRGMSPPGDFWQT